MWEKTVMNRTEMVNILPIGELLKGVNIDNHRVYCGRLIAKHQAEITGDKVIREVVEIIEDFNSMFTQDFDKKYGVSSSVGHTPRGLLQVLERMGYKGVK